jgi:hypothetical protein
MEMVIKKLDLRNLRKRRTRIDVLSVYDGDEDKNKVHAVRETDIPETPDPRC